MQDKTMRMRELVELLGEAGEAYYQQDREIMSNYDYDKLYDELLMLEKETGTILAGSPTMTVGHEIVSELPKIPHESQMLSLDKTKEVASLQEWIGDQEGLLSWKLDGLTIVLTYQEGELRQAVTRGNGEIGEEVTNNAAAFVNLPRRIQYKGELILRGEAVIGYSDFKKINDKIEDAEAKYKNPRNLCSGSVRQLNSQITADRRVHFFAFGLVKAEGVDFKNSREEQLQWLIGQGFEAVEYKRVNRDLIAEAVAEFEQKIPTNDFPSDGLVLLFDDIAYGESLGVTSKFPRDSIAFKWADEMKETTLLEIEWSPSRTGLINPVAIFEPVELEGTTVSRASVHNISILKGLQLGIGDRIQVYKANMIIPQIGENLTRSDSVEIPDECPVCSGAAEIKQVNDVQSLYCTNPKCQVKKLKSFSLFVSRNGMNIDGLSEATLEKFIQKGFIHEFADLFHLDQHREEIVEMEGLGEKSFQNLKESIEQARKTDLFRVIYGLGISNIGLANAKLLCKEYQNDIDRIRNAKPEDLIAINGFGEVMAAGFVAYFQDDENNRQLDNLLAELEINQVKTETQNLIFEGVNFVITGSVNRYKNRQEVKDIIEARGGKVTGSVTSKTNYLINNDVTSTSSKNKKARELDIPILTEDEFAALLDE